MSIDVSIIIPAYNEAAVIRSAVRRAWEAGARQVIVVDGSSRDDTLARARGCECLAMHAPRGRAAQLNAGARQATCDVLLFLHADNWLEPGGTDQIAQALTDPAIPGGAFRQQIDATPFVYRWIERWAALRARFGRAFGDQGIFIRRELFQSIGGFPEVAFMEDVLFMKKMRSLWRPALLAGPIHTSARRWRQHGVVRQTLLNWSLLSAVKFGVSPDRLARFYPPHSK